MSNKLETSSASKLLNNKINIMLSSLNKSFADFENKTKEDIVNSFNEVVLKFYNSLEEPLFNFRELKEGKEPNIEELNKSFTAARQDLEIVYEEMASLRSKLASSFNGVAALSSRVKGSIAQASSDLLDYQIQNTNKNFPTFMDKFYTLAKINTNESDYNKDKMFTDTKNGRIVLPLNGEAEQLKLKRLQIIEDSIGTPGNNQEIGSVVRDNLQFLNDNSLDTWFEFEQVSKNEITNPTILNIKIELDQEKIFNILEVATLAMPNGTYPAIAAIKGSTDNNIYFDLMPQYLGQTTLDSLGNEVIQLSPNSDNPSEENILYFFPKKVKYITIKFTEDASHTIRTPSGLRNRTAIAIKELKVKAQKFKQTGEFLSIDHLSDKEISKVAITTEETLPPNFDTTLKYFISTDSGKNWDEINPSQKIASEIPEVLNYNIDFLQSSKKTDLPVRSVRLKADIEIKTSVDDTTINSSFKNIPVTEFTSINGGTKSIVLSKKPIGSVNLYQVNYGSVGAGSFYRLPSSNIIELEDRVIAKLPLDVFHQQSIKEDQEVLYIDNNIWTRVGSLDGSSATDQDYEFDYINNIITFHKLDDQGNREGKKPVGNILFKLKRESPLFTNQGETYGVTTKFKHDGIKEKIKIYKILEETQTKSVRLRNLSTVHKLGASEIQSVSIAQDLNNKLVSEKEYVNGVIELKTTGDYSIDKEKGILYTFSEISSSEEIIVEVNYKEVEALDFNIKNGDISVNKANYKTSNKTFNIALGSTYTVDLGIKNIAKGTIQFTNFPLGLVTEVPFDRMDESFQDNNISGAYAIDYLSGVLYSRNPLVGTLSGILAAADYFIEYNISKRIPQSAYAVDKELQTVVFNDDYVLDYFAEREGSTMQTPLFKIEYGYAEEIKESSSELIQYVTPFLNEYKIKTTTKDTLV